MTTDELVRLITFVTLVAISSTTHLQRKAERSCAIVDNRYMPGMNARRGAKVNCSQIPAESCTCTLDDPLQVWCGVKISFIHTHAKDALFECHQDLVLEDFRTLDSIHLAAAPYFHVDNCPLFDVPLSEQFKLVDTTNVCDFKFLPRDSNVTWKSSHFRGMTNVRAVTLTDGSLRALPGDLFTLLPNLENVMLYGNELTELPEDIFLERGPKLLQVDLSNNHLSHLAHNLLRNMTRLKILNLQQNYVDSLHPDTFLDLNSLLNLYLGKNKLSVLPDALFSPLLSLRELDLSDNQLTFLPTNMLAQIVTLETINLSGNELKTLPAGIFSTNKHIQYIYISRNTGSSFTLPSGVFSQLPQLLTVDVSNSHLTNLPEDSFSGSLKLREIDLSQNQLSYLSPSLFLDCQRLRILRLHHNLVKIIEGNTFVACQSMSTLDLSDNRMYRITSTALQGLQRLQSLKLNRNFLDSIDLPSMPSLEELDVSFNNVSFSCSTDPTRSESSLKNCPQLKAINFAYNNITSLCGDWLRLKNLTSVNLSRNYITSIYGVASEDAHSNLTVDVRFNLLRSVNLSKFDRQSAVVGHKGFRTWLLKGNPFECDCSEFMFLQSTRGREIDIFDVSGAVCAGPNTLVGNLLSSIEPEHLDCSEDCHGPCSCLFRPAERTLTFNCEARGLLGAPEKLPQLSFVSRTELLLGENNLTTMPDFRCKGYEKVDLLNVSHNQIRYISEFHYNLKTVFFDFNKINSIPYELILRMASLQKVKLDNNPWDCVCQLQPLVDFVQRQAHKVENWNETYCLNGQRLIDVTENLCLHKWWSFIAIPAALLFILLLIAAIYYKFSQEIKAWLYVHNVCLAWVIDEDAPDVSEYDVFISCSEHDEGFVVKELLPVLETKPHPLKVWLPVRDQVAGDPIVEHIPEQIAKSRRTLLVVSRNFVDDVWSLHEARNAHRQALNQKTRRVVVVLLEDVGPLDKLDPELRAYLTLNTYAKWGDSWFWYKLRYALPHPELSRQKNSVEMKTL